MDRRVVRPSVEGEVNEEFSFHVEMRVRELVQQGWDEEQARSEAVRRFGDIELVKERCRDLGRRRNVSMNRRQWWDEIRQDLAYAVRQLRRAPSFAVVTIVTLGIAIGANTAVFSVVNGVLMAPLPYPDSEELAVLWTRYLPPSGFDIDKFVSSAPELLDFQETTETLQSVGIFQRGSRALTGDGQDAQRVRVGFLSRGVLPTLGVQPQKGRWFTPEEDAPSGPDVTILSHTLWQNRYGADPEILGKSVLMNGVPTEVVGVMPPGFEFPSTTVAWLPLGLDRSNEGGRASHSYSAIGRLAAGMTHEDLAAELEVVRGQWASEYEHNEHHFMWAQDLHTEVVADAPTVLLVLMAAVGLVLLVACANIANLLLARSERRQAEVAMRSTLGADRGRIVRQLTTESLVLAGLSAVLGVALAWMGTKALVALNPGALPRLELVGLDATVLLFTLGVTVVTALLFGIAPAYLAGRRATQALAGSSLRATGGRRTSSLRRSLVTAEVAVSLVVVIMAGLVVRSFSALTGTDLGMDPERLVTFSITLPGQIYQDDELIPGQWEDVLERVRAVPGVTEATAATYLPFGGRSQWDFLLDDRPPRQDGEMAWNAGISVVASDYFQTMGIPVLAGRSLQPSDGPADPLVAVVSETMASRYWPGQDVLGKRFGYEQSDHSVPWMTIVGVVPDPVTADVSEEAYPHVYVPHAQAGVSTFFMPRSLDVAVRTALAPESIVPALRRAVAGFDRDLPLYRVQTMEDIVAESLAGPRVTTNLLGLFALIALGLATVGIYGVISYSVAGRTREIGVRMALGAQGRAISRMVLTEGATPVVIGIVVGLAGAYYATRLLTAMLYGVAPTDPATFTLLPVMLLLIGLFASWIPAFRATRIAPTEALRE